MLQNIRAWGEGDRRLLDANWDSCSLDELFTMFRNKPRTSILCEAYNLAFESGATRTKCLAMIRSKLVETGLHDPLLAKTMKWFQPPS